MRVVVTGGVGFIGTQVVSDFLARGYEVVLVDFLRDRLRFYEQFRLPILKDVYRNLAACVDVVEPYQFLADPATADCYVHLGACVDTGSVADELYERNVDFVRTLVCTLPYNSNVVFASSAATYGENGSPCNPYGATKCIGENLFRAQATLNVTALRFFNVFGRNEHHKGDMASVPFKLAQAYKNRNRFDMFCPDASRDFISVADVSRAVVMHTESGRKNSRFEVFDVGRGENETFRDLDYKIRILFGASESRCKEVPMPEKYKGRYQFYTRAGARGNISPYIKIGDLRDSLEEQFCEKN